MSATCRSAPGSGRLRVYANVSLTECPKLGQINTLASSQVPKPSAAENGGASDSLLEACLSTSPHLLFVYAL
jgi:hypothetical protein